MSNSLSENYKFVLCAACWHLYPNTNSIIKAHKDTCHDSEFFEIHNFDEFKELLIKYNKISEDNNSF